MEKFWVYQKLIYGGFKVSVKTYKKYIGAPVAKDAREPPLPKPPMEKFCVYQKLIYGGIKVNSINYNVAILSRHCFFAKIRSIYTIPNLYFCAILQK